MATKKKTTKKVVKKEENATVLKMLGAIINSAAIGLYAVANIPVVLSSFGLVMHFKYADNFTEQNVVEALKYVNIYALREVSVLLGSVLFFEILNYFLYLRKSSETLIGMIVIEAIAFVVIGIMIGFYYPMLYIMLLPVVTGLINYAILKKEGK